MAIANLTTQTTKQARLVLDIVDARTNKLVWRGWAQRRVGGVVDDQILMRKYVIDGAERMMAQFPPLPK